MNFYAIIVGGGSGKRMNNAVAKQFLLLHQKPVLMHTLTAFSKSVYQPKLILVLPEGQQAYWEELCINYHFDLPHQVVNGGEQRFHSVRNGLLHIKQSEDALVAIHDGVRPLVSTQLIDKTYQTADEKGNAIVCIRPSDSIRQLKDQQSKLMNRDELVLVQTPQTFRLDQLRKAYQQPYKDSFTDDASVVEKAGYPIQLMEGERCNLKITYEEDLEVAAFLLGKSGHSSH